MSAPEGTVSVVIPVYNGERSLAEALQSVFDQTSLPTEVIVVDDGSTDGTAAVVRKFGSAIQYVYHSRAGQGASRNRGVAMAHGEFLSFLDADDLWVKEKLSLQKERFVHQPDLDMVFGLVQQFISPELSETVRNKLVCPPDPMPGYVPGAMLVKRESFLRVGYFETWQRIGEFVDWIMRAQEMKLKSFMLDTVVLKRRLHEENIGRKEQQFQTDYVRVLKAALDRRRQKGTLGE
jgi:glycosyltransferase involved in cell wall biosynthesis